ncbi:MAG: hypothetical protein JSR80_00780 [Verrucomicrobia bacterium]|nr:hypothetical protein [Verrucomicrobiota bacterium]
MSRLWLMLLLIPILVCATPSYRVKERAEERAAKKAEQRQLKSYIEELKQREYEVVGEFFIKKDHQGSINIEPPGRCYLPISMESYRQYGENWDKDPFYQKAYPYCKGKWEILAVVPIGTKFRIVDLQEKEFAWNYWNVYVQLDLPSFEKPVHANFIFAGWTGEDYRNITPWPAYAKEVGAPDKPPLEGKVVGERYYAPNNMFSCQFNAIGEEKYKAGDAFLDKKAIATMFPDQAGDGDWGIVSAIFADSAGNYKRADIYDLGWEQLDEKALKEAFEACGIETLEMFEEAKGIERLSEEMIGDDMFFVALSIKNTGLLKGFYGRDMPLTRGYLVFQHDDKLILLVNQRVTLTGKSQPPGQHEEDLKNELLEFKKTFEFDLVPAIGCVEKADTTEVSH